MNSFNAEMLKQENRLGQCLTQARRAHRLSQKEVAAALRNYRIAVSSAAVSKWEKGDSLPNPYQLLALCHLLGVSDPLASFTGLSPLHEDYSPELNQQGLNLLTIFRDALIASGKYAPRSRRAHADVIPEATVRVFSLPAAAGAGSPLEDEDYDEIGFDPANIPHGTDFGIRVTGSSMLPRYVDGQIVFVEKCQSLANGEIGVFVVNGNAYIKQYIESRPTPEEAEDYTTSDGRLLPKITLFSLNRDYAHCDVHVGLEDTLFVVGRVLS